MFASQSQLIFSTVIVESTTYIGMVEEEAAESYLLYNKSPINIITGKCSFAEYISNYCKK